MINQEISSLRWSKLLPRLARYLPANKFNQLRNLPQNLEQLDADQHPTIVNDLLKINRMLDPLHRVLVQYMPRYLIEVDPTPGQPYGEILEGSFIWADVTGFTALTEMLAKQGHAKGNELMNQIMNRLFTEILDPLIASGGDLLIFAGDAALVFFPKLDEGEDVFQAIRAALRMERAILPFASFETEYGQCSLTMSAGVERGTVYAGIVGTQKRMELLVSGIGIHRTMHAEEQSAPGQVTLGPQALAIAQNHFLMDGAHVVDNLGNKLGDYEISLPSRKRGSSVAFGMDIPEVLKTINASLQRVEQLAPFLPEDMLAHMVNTERRVRTLVSEFRPVAVQFINIVGIEELAKNHGAASATAVFQNCSTRAEEIITQHEGIISQIDAYAKGFFLVNTFGTPKAHEGTTRYAVSAALQLAKLVQQINQEFNLEPPIEQCGGITYGLAFNGEIGANYRRESVIAGPAINRAARLMNKAEFGQIILDADIWADIQTAFVGEQLPSVHLKGIDGAVVIVNVHKIRRGTRLSPLERPILGRKTEQNKLYRSIEALLNHHQGNFWMVSGETGIGKTSLVLDLADYARRKNLKVLAGRCQPHGKNIPLFIWVELLTGWLDIDESVDKAKQRTQLTQELTALGISGAEAYLSKLLALDNVPTQNKSSSQASPQPTSLAQLWGQTTSEKTIPTEQPQGTLGSLLGNRLVQTSQKSERTLWSRLEDRISGLTVIIELLQKLAYHQPLLIILEDIHWLDRESEFLLNKLLNQMVDTPLILVLTGRHNVEAENLLAMPLNGLTDKAITKVAQRVFAAYSLDNSLAKWVCKQAHGNPLYAEELCQALQHDHAVIIDRQTGEVRWTKQAPALPLSLHELMLVRLDELPLPQQDILKRAAVIGMLFEFEGLLKLYSRNTDEKRVETTLHSVVRAGFLIEIQHNTYTFIHPLMQEAIYATLSFSQRQDWHTKIGNWLINRQTEQYLEIIAYHCLHGTDQQKGAEFGLRAGNKARKNGIYTGALTYYEQIHTLSNISTQLKMQTYEAQGDVLALLEDIGAAQQAYSQAINLGSQPAAEKLAILAGDLAQLQQIDTPTLQPWVESSCAYLLAIDGQFEKAIVLAETALAQDTVNETTKWLVNAIKNREISASYKDWLSKFIQAVLVTSLT